MEEEQIRKDWERETDTHIYFYGGVFSQWYRSIFKIDDIEYNCAEQYMMAEKARLFNDEESLYKIMKSHSPSDQKAQGRKVKNFDAIKWEVIAQAVVEKANYAKFTQNDYLKKILLSTGTKKLVEASPVDRIWGIGLSASDDRVLDESKWRGTNGLGICIGNVRYDIRMESIPWEARNLNIGVKRNSSECKFCGSEAAVCDHGNCQVCKCKHYCWLD